MSKRTWVILVVAVGGMMAVEVEVEVERGRLACLTNEEKGARKRSVAIGAAPPNREVCAIEAPRRAARARARIIVRANWRRRRSKEGKEKIDAEKLLQSVFEFRFTFLRKKTVACCFPASKESSPRHLLRSGPSIALPLHEHITIV